MGSEEDARTRLLEWLVSDPAFRAEFRRDPVGAARHAGLDALADDLLAAGGDPLQTLDLRESRSSLAGVAMAAALEGAGVSAHGLHEGGAAHVNAHAHEPIDPAAYGMEGSGGRPSADALALLRNHNLTFDADGVADLKAGRIDPRVVSLLATLSREHTITVSAMCSDHPQLTSGGAISNHYYGRAFDIATVDGQPVGPGNTAAKRVAVALAKLSPSIRPSEIGSPWALSGAAYFSDAAHQNHLHVGYDDPVAPGWRPPAAALPAASDPVEPDDPQTDDADGGGDDESDGDDDGSGREDGGSGDTEAEADEESDGDDEEDEDDEEDDDEDDDEEDDDDEDEDGEEEDEDEDEDDEDEDDEDEEDEDDDDEDADETDEGTKDDGAEDDDAGGGTGESPESSGDAWQEPDVEAGAYPGDDAPKEEIAAWMAGEAQRRGIPSELPVMAALVESGLGNLSYGDADSVGFFQMRTSIWNQGVYAGYADSPDLQLKWFLDQAVAVKKQRLEQGLPVADSKQFGEWIADIERPAEQYRGRYQLRLDEAHELLERGSTSSRGSADVLKLSVIDPEEARRAKDG